MKKTKMLSFALTMIMLLSCMFGCASSTQTRSDGQEGSGETKVADELVILINVDASTFDPHFTVDTPTEMINRNLYNNLVRYNSDMEILPDLAEDWSVSEDGTAYTFHLKQNVLFHDGSKFTAEDVKATFDRLLDPDVGAAKRSVLADISEVVVEDEYTVTIRTTYSMGGLLQKLCHPCAAMMSADAIEQYGADIATHPIGTNAYKLKQYTPGEAVVMEHFDDYFGGEPMVQTVRWLIVPEDTTRSLMLESGNADVAYMLPTTEVARLSTNPDIKRIDVTSVTTQGIYLNCTKDELSDRRVRQALNYAVDKEQLLNGLLDGSGTISDAPMSVKTWGYNSIMTYPYDLEKAKQLLAEAGYPNGFDLEVWVAPARFFMARQIMEYVQSEFAKIGVNLTIREWEHFAMLEEVKKGGYDCMYGGWSPSTGDADQALYSVFHSSQWVPNYNRALYKNEQVDALLEAGRTETDLTKRKEIYKEAETLIMEDCPWVFLYSPQQTVMFSSKVDGLEFLPTEHLLIAGVTKSN